MNPDLNTAARRAARIAAIAMALGVGGVLGGLGVATADRGDPGPAVERGNIVALDSGTVAKWQSAIAGAVIAAPAVSTSL
jgi:hypothetical protein